jgi:hypothetical protein
MSVGLRFFETMNIALLQGRTFRADDERSDPAVAVINEAMARHYFGRENPIGRRVNGKEVVGVVKNTTYTSLREPSQRIFYALVGVGLPIADVRFAVRMDAAGPGAASAIRAAVQEVVALPITQMETPDDRVEATLVRERLLVRFAGGFSLLALLLACIGLYGALSYSVAQRTADIGVRMALGARATDIVTMMLRETSVMVAAGLVVGLAGAVASTRLFAALLFGLTPTDPLTLAVVVLVLAAAAIVAGYLPARRASRVDPMVALRHT